jgi:4-diphosphocytidyl-2-C-methyl-D-erythritol kinase
LHGQGRMFVRGSDSDWEVRAPAKINFFFEVLARRADGFHEVETLMFPIRLFDTVSLTSRPGGHIDLSCRWAAGLGHRSSGSTPVPEGDDNLVVQALRLLRGRASVEAGAVVRLVKRIPAAAGLGGGSSDAAAALLLANRAWQLGWTRAQLADLGAELGSDVPFFLADSAAVCRGRGERVRPVKGLGQMHLVVVKPPAGLSTARVFAACQPAATPRRSGPLLTALQRGELARAGRLLYNRLHGAAMRLSPWIERLAGEFTRLDCLGHQMTGSGTAYFGLCRTARHARYAAGVLRSRRVGSVFQVGTCH